MPQTTLATFGPPALLLQFHLPSAVPYFLQVFLVLVAVIAVPCMLFPKPFILKKRHEAAMRSRAHYGSVGDDGTGAQSPRPWTNDTMLESSSAARVEQLIRIQMP